MIVCVCTAVTESQIRRAVAEGAASLAELRSRLGVDSECGCCADEAESVLRRCLLETAAAREALHSQAPNAASRPR